MLISSQQKTQEVFPESLQNRPEASMFRIRDYDYKQYADDRKNSTQETELSRDNEVCSTILKAGQTLQGTGFEANVLSTFARHTTKDVTRYKMAWRALEFYWHLGFTEKIECSVNPWYYSIPSALVQRSKDWPEVGNNLEESSVGFGFTTAGVIYGGLHALAWFAHFESSTQQQLWRIPACVVMGGYPVCWGIVESVAFIADRRSIRPLWKGYFFRFFEIALALVMLAYMLARAYLVVECFINLSHLPAGAYDVPKWASYFPHIS